MTVIFSIPEMNTVLQCVEVVKTSPCSYRRAYFEG